MDSRDKQILRSEELGETFTEWWDAVHKANDTFWISGDISAEEVWNRLGVRHLLVPSACVLEIGVGVGRSARALLERGCSVSALDISSIALKRVSSFAKCYLPEQPLPFDTFDVALSHLVAQHMTDQQLSAQLKTVIASLKPTGILAMQFSSRIDGLTHAHNEESRVVKWGGVLRSPEEMEEMAQAAWAEVVSLKKDKIFPKNGCQWYVIHLMKGVSSRGQQ